LVAMRLNSLSFPKDRLIWFRSLYNTLS